MIAGCTSQAPHWATSRTATQPAISAAPPSEGRSATPAVAVEATLPCDQAIDADAHPGSLKVLLGVVALPVSPGYGALQTARTGESGPLRLFAKTGLVVKAGASFQLAIPAPFSAHARIGWGSPASSSRQIDVDRCAAPGSGWSAFAGGYWVDRPACLPVVVRSHGDQATVHVGIGTACPGQAAPEPPTQS
jgi:hypothetical protein